MYVPSLVCDLNECRMTCKSSILDKVMKIRGQGTFGRVVEAWDRQRRHHVALKVIRAQPKFKNAAKGEVKILKHVLARDPLNEK